MSQPKVEEDRWPMPRNFCYGGANFNQDTGYRLVRHRKQEGEAVRVNDVLCSFAKLVVDVGDEANVEFLSPFDGVVGKFLIAEGEVFDTDPPAPIVRLATCPHPSAMNSRCIVRGIIRPQEPSRVVNIEGGRQLLVSHAEASAVGGARPRRGSSPNAS
jgi:pyruvate/2-oxoglutarate dehydrogenase complex dihydrolipoamide acyltransferase (E2) component